jgi:GNAT superfamily N-acetyltransferase
MGLGGSRPSRVYTAADVPRRNPSVTIKIAELDKEIAACFPVMRELRLHLCEEEFVERVRRQNQSGYLLAFLEDEGRVFTTAGYRYNENLAWGRHMYVDDLVTLPKGRSRGYGKKMLDWLIEQSRARDCNEFHLDSGVQRFGAHRFYLTHRMDITSHHFALRLKA